MTTVVKSLGLFRGVQYELVYHDTLSTYFSWNDALTGAENREFDYGNCEKAKGRLVEVLESELNDFVTSKINTGVLTTVANDDLILTAGQNLSVGVAPNDPACWLWYYSKLLIQAGDGASPSTVGVYTNWAPSGGSNPTPNPDGTNAYVSYKLKSSSKVTKWVSVASATPTTAISRGYLVYYPRGLVKGEVILGTCDPVDTCGKYGDVYINKATCVMFGPKTCTWGCGTKLAYNVPVGYLSSVCSSDYNNHLAPACGSGKPCNCGSKPCKCNKPYSKPCNTCTESHDEESCYESHHSDTESECGSYSHKQCNKKDCKVKYSLFAVNWGKKCCKPKCV